MLEQEIKVLLVENEYNLLKVLCKYTESKSVVQTNYYFDTEKFFFNKDNITVRVREKEDNYSLTIKVMDYERSNEKIKTSNEYNFRIDYKTFLRITQNDVGINVHDYCNDQFLRKYEREFLSVKYLGKLVTHRIKFRPSNSLPYFELDKNYYLGSVDWELECEINSIDEIEAVENWLSTMSIKLIRSQGGKSGRFIDRLISQMDNGFAIS